MEARHRQAAVLALIAGAPWVSAQSQAIGLRYSAKQLNCARFVENAASKIVTQAGRQGREQTSGRSGVWQFRAAPSNDEVALEGWLDSLSLWRRSTETTIKPDTDGLLGGRYRGTLSGGGVYSGHIRPFVPDEVREVAGMGTALDDFFPPLPPRSLRTGQVWAASGVTIRRLPDSAMSGVPLYRFQVETRRRAASAEIESDSLPLELRQVSQERGTFVWHPLLGLLQRERWIVVETTVPASRTVPQPVRSKIEQRITVLRDLSVPPEEPGRCVQ